MPKWKAHLQLLDQTNFIPLNFSILVQWNCKQQHGTNAASRWPEHKTSMQKQQHLESGFTACQRSELEPDTVKVPRSFQVCGWSNEGMSIKHVLIWQMKAAQRRRRNQAANSHLSFILPSSHLTILPWCHVSFRCSFNGGHRVKLAHQQIPWERGRPGVNPWLLVSHSNLSFFYKKWSGFRKRKKSKKRLQRSGGRFLCSEMNKYYV